LSALGPAFQPAVLSGQSGMTIIAATAPLALAVSISAGRRVTVSAGLRNNDLFSTPAARWTQFFPTLTNDYALFHPQQAAK
jgi:hypothetical protein